MWMLLGLVGVVVASGMADLFTQDSEQDPVDDGQDPQAVTADEGEGAGGDLLDHAFGAGWQPTGLSAQVDGGAQIPADGGDPAQGASDQVWTGEGPPSASVGDRDVDWTGWVDDTFISSDTPPSPPENHYIDSGDDGRPTAGGEGDDTVVGGLGDDWLEGAGGADSLVGGAGADTLIGGTGEDTLLGGDGDDSLVAGAGGGLIRGGRGDDVLTGGGDDDLLFGGTGDDTLEGGHGADLLVAGTGADLLMGGSGNDTLFGFTPDGGGRDIDGADFLNGGSGDDVLVVGSGDHAHGGDGADDFVVGAWIDPEDVAVIADFSPGDLLSVAYDGSGPAPVITTAFDPDAGGLRVMLDGQPVAILTGVESIPPEALRLVAVAQGG